MMNEYLHCYATHTHVSGISTGLSIAGGNQTCSNTLALFSMYSSEVLGRGTQPQEWEIPVHPTLQISPCVIHLPTDARLVQMALSLGPNQTAASVVGE